MLKNLSSAAVVIGALSIKLERTPRTQHKTYTPNVSKKTTTTEPSRTAAGWVCVWGGGQNFILMIKCLSYILLLSLRTSSIFIQHDQTLLWTCIVGAHLQCVNNHYATIMQSSNIKE